MYFVVIFAPATSGVGVQRSIQLSYGTSMKFLTFPFAECTPCSNSLCSRLLSEHPLSTRLSGAGQFLPYHSAGGYFRLHSTNGRKQKTSKKP